MVAPDAAAAVLDVDNRLRDAARRRRHRLLVRHPLRRHVRPPGLYALHLLCRGRRPGCRADGPAETGRWRPTRPVRHAVGVVFGGDVVPRRPGRDDQRRPRHRLFRPLQQSPLFLPVAAHSGVAHWRGVFLAPRCARARQRDGLDLAAVCDNCRLRACLRSPSPSRSC